MKTTKPISLTLSLIACTLFVSTNAFAQAPETKTSTSISGQTAETSTAGIQFPEDGGVLPRAGTPQAGASDPLERSEIPEGGTPTEWRHQSTPPGKKAAPEMSLEWHGYLRVIGQYTENDDLPYIGRNDGFRLGNARLEMTTRYGDSLSAVISVESSDTRSDGANDANASLDIGLRDAFLNYELSNALSIKFGRFKAPYDLGELESTSNRVFIDAPVETRGVSRTQGIETEGLTQGRQLGLWFGSDRLGLSRWFDLGYVVALTNGKTNALAFNDNDRPAGFLRLSAHYKKMITLNVGGFVDTRTDGELPNQFDEEVTGGELSIQADISGLRIEAQGLIQITKFTTTGENDIMSIGGHAQWAYRIWNLEVAYRFGYFDPNDRYDADVIMEHTLGVSYFLQDMPLRLSLNGTFADEEYPVDNHRAEILAQYTF